MINRVVLVGRMTRDPELKYTSNGIANVRFTLAVNRSFKNEQGNQQADFISCVSWRNQAENMAKFLKKGSLIGVEGRIETGSYDDNGTTRYKTQVLVSSIIFLDTKKEQDQANQYQSPNESVNYHSYAPDFESTNFNPHEPSFSTPPSANYNNPFDTATARAGQIRNEPVININDDDLPF